VPGKPGSTSFVLISKSPALKDLMKRLNDKPYLLEKSFEVTRLIKIDLNDGYINNAGIKFIIRSPEPEMNYYYFTAYKQKEDGKFLQMKLQDDKIEAYFKPSRVFSSKLFAADYVPNLPPTESADVTLNTTLIENKSKVNERRSRAKILEENEDLKVQLKKLKTDFEKLQQNMKKPRQDVTSNTDSTSNGVPDIDSNIIPSTLWNTRSWSAAIHIPEEGIDGRITPITSNYKPPKEGYWLIQYKDNPNRFLRLAAIQAQPWMSKIRKLPYPANMSQELPFFDCEWHEKDKMLWYTISERIDGTIQL
jgi:hypothetical protein